MRCPVPASASRRSSVRRIAPGVLSVAVLALSGSCGGRAESRFATVHVTSERGIEVLRCVDLGASDRGRAYRAEAPGFYVAHGHSGSPVFDEAGTLVGGMNAYLVAGGLAFRVEPIASIRAARQRVVERVGAKIADLRVVPGIARPAPGQAVWLLWVWGEVNRGVTGAITETDGDWVEFLAHAPDGRTGAVEARMAVARSVGLRALPNGEFESELVPVEPLGTCLALTNATAVGVVGREPPPVRFTIEWTGWPEWNRTFSTSRRWSLSRAAVFAAILEVLAPLDSLPPEQVTRDVWARVQAGEGPESRVVPAEPADDTPTAAARTAAAILAAIDLAAPEGSALADDVRVVLNPGVVPP